MSDAVADPASEVGSVPVAVPAAPLPGPDPVIDTDETFATVILLASPTGGPSCTPSPVVTGRPRGGGAPGAS
ncbi:hypothetical protein [Streptomyces sp. ID38640]|uniref:hypothetical protein n=1 Tax=Streptomyces sp. ID38640 TaxID=1265399 RepID=UPI002180B05B|nr:hypothetical protein [Streptomyces sp. ID38640]